MRQLNLEEAQYKPQTACDPRFRVRMRKEKEEHSDAQPQVGSYITGQVVNREDFDFERDGQAMQNVGEQQYDAGIYETSNIDDSLKYY